MAAFTTESYSGPPTSGHYNAGDTLVDASSTKWVCVKGGSPGTWAVASLYGGDKFSTDV